MGFFALLLQRIPCSSLSAFCIERIFLPGHPYTERCLSFLLQILSPLLPLKCFPSPFYHCPSILVPDPLEAWVCGLVIRSKTYVTGTKDDNCEAPIGECWIEFRPGMRVTYFLGLLIIRYLGGTQMIGRRKFPIGNRHSLFSVNHHYDSENN